MVIVTDRYYGFIYAWQPSRANAMSLAANCAAPNCAGPIESFRQQIVLGPYKVFSDKFLSLCWAHSRLSVANFVSCAGPIQGFWRQLMGTMLGPSRHLAAHLG